MILTTEEFKTAASKRAVKEVEIPEIGGSVFVREVTAGEFDRVQRLCNKMDQEGTMFRAACVVYFLSDADGNRIYSDAEANALNGMNGKVIDRIFDAGFAFNKTPDVEKN